MDLEKAKIAVSLVKAKSKIVVGLIKFAIIGVVFIIGIAFLGIGGAGISENGSSSNNGGATDGYSSSSSSSNILEDYIASFENQAMLEYKKGIRTGYDDNKYVYACISEDKTQYLCHEDIGLRNYTRNFGFGVCHIHEGAVRWIDEYNKYGIDIGDELYKHVDKNSIIHSLNPSNESDPSTTREVRIDVEIVDAVKSDILESVFISAVRKGYKEQMRR